MILVGVVFYRIALAHWYVRDGSEIEMEHPTYKPYYWGLDTVFNAKVKLRIGDIFSLKKYPGFPGPAAEINFIDCDDPYHNLQFQMSTAF